MLQTYGQSGLPPGSFVDGEIRDVSSVSAAIETLDERPVLQLARIVGIAGLRAITREIDLPFVPDAEIDSAVRFQSEEVIPFPPDQTILPSQVLADYTSPEGDKMRRVPVAAAHVDLVNGVIEAVEKAGPTVEGVDLISSALVRAVGGRTLGTTRGHRVRRGGLDRRRRPPAGASAVRPDHWIRWKCQYRGGIRCARSSYLRCRGCQASHGEPVAEMQAAKGPLRPP